MCCKCCEELRRRIEALERRGGTRDRADVAVLDALAQLNRPFTTGSVFRHARLVNAALAAALEAADLGSPKELGWLLRRCEGQSGAFLIERVGESRDGLRWRVSRV